MAVYYSLPKLKSLTQGSRIAFIRQLRHMSQQTFGEKIGIHSDGIRNLVCRYERKDRDIKRDRLKKMAEVLDVNIKMIERWDFRDPEQLYYELLWIEELCPGMILRKDSSDNPENGTYKVLLEKHTEWRKMKTKYVKGSITYEEYLDWKLGRYKGSEADT